MKIRRELQTGNPKSYYAELRNANLKHNNRLKIILLQSIKPLRLKRYKSHDILRVYIAKDSSNEKLRPLGIRTLRERCVQMLLNITMLTYMEPLGDVTSFGYRPGRNAHQLISLMVGNLA